MHEKTLIMPIVNQLALILESYYSIVIEYGEYSGLTPKLIIDELRMLLPHLENFFSKLIFQQIRGEIHCLECDFQGPGGQLFTEPISHTTIIISCPKCYSGITIITRGLGLKIISPKMHVN